MPVRLGRVPVKEGKAAAAYILDMKPAELDGYIVVGITPDGDYEISSNADCQAHAMATLADVVAAHMLSMATEASHLDSP